MTTLSITLQDEDKSFIETVVKSGRYLTESEVVADALAGFKVQEEIRKQRLASLKAKIQVGIDELDRGESAVWNVDEVKAKGRALLASQQAAA
ncbi:MAG: type II toxin-antitoxin system ParD family antitoxin [Chthoniobacterales bacterium]